MSGYNPMHELGKELEELATSPKRAVAVPPPPTDDFTQEQPLPSSATSDPEPTPPPTLRPDPPEPTGRADVVPRSRRRSGRLVVRRPNGPMKPITADLPAHLIERLTSAKLDAAVDGRVLSITDLLSEGILALPMRPTRVAALLERYTAQTNYGVRPGEDGFHDEARLSTRITPEAHRHIATVVRAVHQEYGVKLARKDLYAVALLQALSVDDGA